MPMIKDKTKTAPEVKSSIKPAPEKKATGNEVASAFDEFMRAFESYKETNDRRLSEMEARVGEDVVTTEKMDRISHFMDDQKRKMDRLAIKGSRPALGDMRSPIFDSEHKHAFNDYIRKGNEHGLRQIEPYQGEVL